MIELVGIFAFLTNVAGNLMLARKSERGWWVRIVSIVAWFVYATGTSSLAMTLNAVVFLGINVYGLARWRRDRLSAFSTPGTEEHANVIRRLERSGDSWDLDDEVSGDRDRRMRLEPRSSESGYLRGYRGTGLIGMWRL